MLSYKNIKRNVFIDLRGEWHSTRKALLAINWKNVTQLLEIWVNTWNCFAFATVVQERWRATSEQTKVESVQRSLEEERRLMSQHFSIEREELERAKVGY